MLIQSKREACMCEIGLGLSSMIVISIVLGLVVSGLVMNDSLDDRPHVLCPTPY